MLILARVPLHGATPLNRSTTDHFARGVGDCTAACEPTAEQGAPDLYHRMQRWQLRLPVPAHQPGCRAAMLVANP